MTSTTHVRILLGQEEYALPVEGVLEIAERGSITPVPGAPAGIVGVRNLRGQVMPVIDLGSVLGLAPGSGPERIVVVEAGDSRAGLAVDEVLDVGPIPKPTAGGDTPYLTGTTLRDGVLVGVVDLPAVLGSFTHVGGEG